MRMLRLLLIPVLAFGASSAVLAQAPRKPNPAVRAACQADMQRLCHGVKPGGGRIGECVKAHISEMSPGCLEALRAARQGQGQAQGQGQGQGPH